GQSVHRGCELLPLDRGGEPDADDHRQCASGGRPDQGAAGRMKLSRATLILSAAALLLAAGLARRRRFRAQRILRISRVVSDLDRAEAFYRDGLEFRAVARGRSGKAELAALGLGDAGAEEVVMRLGAQDIALVRFAAPGRPYPRDSRSDDLWFQHLAIVVDDMDTAHARLCAHGGWRPISENGPQLL